MNQKPAHGFVVGVLNQRFSANIPSGWIVRCQLPITLDRSEPEPDLVVACGVHADYRDRHPSGGDCDLVIEVADTSVMKDRAKASIYARAGVREYWIFNLVENQVELYSDGDGTAYRSTNRLKSDQMIEAVIGQATIKFDLTDLLAD